MEPSRNEDMFIMLMNPDENSADMEQVDDSNPEPAEQFNIDLTAEHNYLGNFERVAGVKYLEPNRNYTLPVIFHSSLVFPGETIPMILSRHMFLSTMTNDSNEEGALFGLMFREFNGTHGVTCQIFERSTEVDANTVSIKSRAYQRFMIKPNTEPIVEFAFRNRVQTAAITILPEIVLPHPLYGSFDSNSSYRFRGSEKSELEIQKFQSASLHWPHFVYKMYNVFEAAKKIKEFLLKLNIETVQMDLVSLSFWFSRNAILSRECRRKLFLTDNVFERIILIYQSLKDEKVIVCKVCGTAISKFDNLFPMSKEGIRSNYCNSGGYIHETHTILTAFPDAISYEGSLTDEFSWFPGYTYRYAYCANCNNHLGWKYFSRNLMPKSFIGLSGMNINFANSNSSDSTDYGSEE